MSWNIFVWMILDVHLLQRFSLLTICIVLLQGDLHIAIIFIMKLAMKVPLYYSDVLIPCGGGWCTNHYVTKEHNISDTGAQPYVHFNS